MNLIAEEELKKIISNFQFLFPDDTSAEELDILFNTHCDLRANEGKRNADFDLYFYTTPVNFKFIEPKLPSIEQNLKKKAEVVFKWFPACNISNVRIMPSV